MAKITPQAATFQGGSPMFYCCGATILHQFGHDNTLSSSSHEQPTCEEIGAFLDKQIDHQRKVMRVAFCFCILNDKQLHTFGDEFTKRGFIVSEPMFHPKHNTRLYTVVKPLFEDNKDIPYWSSGEYQKQGQEYGKSYGQEWA